MKTIYFVMCTTQFWNENEKINKSVVCAFESKKEAEQTCKKWNRQKKDSIYHMKKYTIEEVTYFFNMNK